MGKSGNKTKRKPLFSFFVIVAVLIVLIFVFRNNPVIYPFFSKLWPEKLSVADSGEFQSDNVSETVMCGEKLVYYDTDTVYNEDGWSFKLNLSVPRLLAEGDSLLVESKDDNKCVVFSGFKQIYDVTEPSGIILSDVSESGSSIVVSREPGYRCKVTVYSKKGKNVFRAFFGEKYVTDAALSADGRKIALCLMDISGDEIASTVSFYDIGKMEPFAETTDTGNVFSTVKFMDDGNAVAVGDKKAMGFSGSGKAIWQYSFDGSALQYYAYGNSNIALCLKKGDQKLVVLETDGDNYYSLHDAADIKAIDINDDAVMAVTPRLVMFFTTRGYKIAETAVTNDIKAINMPGTGRCGLVIHNFGYEMLEAD